MSLRKEGSSSFDEIHLLSDNEHVMKLSKIDKHNSVNPEEIQPRIKKTVLDSENPSSATLSPHQHSYLGESIITSILSLCCCPSLPLALLSIYYASKVDSYVISGDFTRAKYNARVAKGLIMLSGLMTAGSFLVVFVVFLQLLRPI